MELERELISIFLISETFQILEINLSFEGVLLVSYIKKWKWVEY